MKNAISYFYQINLDDIEKINNNYYFYYAQNSYIVYLYTKGINKLFQLYQLDKFLLSNNIPVYEIILTNKNNVAFMFENELYILMRLPNIKNRTITLQDLNIFKNLSFDEKLFSFLDTSNWSYYWENRVDYVEKQIDEQEDKYPFIEQSLPYYIGLCENAISYYNNQEKLFAKKQISHHRIKQDMDLLEFLNPIELVIDYDIRDVSEYFKSYVLNNNYTIEEILAFLNKINLSKNEAILFITRFLFPSYYFDVYDKIIFSKLKDSDIIEITKKHGYIESILQILFKKYSYYNIQYIDWLLNINPQYKDELL